MASSIFYSQNLAADQYVNWGITSGTNGYGIRDNAGTIEFKNSAGSWAPIAASASSAGGWTKTGAVVALTTGTDTIGSNLRPTDATYTMGDATHGWKEAFINTALGRGVTVLGGNTDLGTDSLSNYSRYVQPGAIHADLVANSSSYFDLEPTASESGTSASYNGQYNEISLYSAFNVYSIYADQNFVWHYGTGVLANGYGGESRTSNEDVGTITLAAGHIGTVNNDAGGTITDAYALSGYVHNVAAGTITRGYGSYIFSPSNNGGGSFPLFMSYYSADLGDGVTGGIANPYYEWFDSRGVYRIREDTVADGSGNPQAVPALYNPRFTKYTPGLANYERIVEQWVANRAVITTESGGTGTLRGITLGASASVPVSVYGVSPIAQPVLATGTGKTVDNVITALQNFGIVRQS